MTKQDLRLEFKRDTGIYTPNPEEFTRELLDDGEQYDLIEYVLWLEEKLLNKL